MKVAKFMLNLNYRNLIRTRIPITKWLPQYTFSLLLQDILAGLTVGMTEIPQGIAYAIVAGLPPSYGLYSGLMDGFIYAIFGGCKDLNIGPTGIVSLMLQPHVTNFGPDVAPLITFLSGIIIFILGIAHLGFVVQFFSYPIVAGFICAGSLQIASTQIKNLLGIPGKADAFLDSWKAVFTNTDQIRKWDTILGLISILLIAVLKKTGVFGSLLYQPKWSKTRNCLGKIIALVSLARNALVVVIGTLIAYVLREELPFKITGDVSGGFPPFQPPSFTPKLNNTEYSFVEVIVTSGVSLIFIPLVSILEAISIAKAFSKGRKLDATQEMFTLGLCNFFGSFVGSMPVTGSFTRSAVNNASGVRTTLAGVFTSLLLILAIAFLTPTFYYVPKATLAAVIICAMFSLFDFEAFVILWKTKKLDFLPFLGTFFCCLFISIEYGIMIGIAVNLLFILYASARPKISIVREKISNCSNDIIIITPKDTLYFPAAEYFRDLALCCEDDNIVVINGKYIRDIDVTVAKSITIIAQEILLKKQRIVFLDFKSSIMDKCVKIDGSLQTYFFSDENLANIITDQHPDNDRHSVNDSENSFVSLSTDLMHEK